MKLIKIIFLICLLVGCKKQMETPEKLVPREEIKAVIKDLYLYNHLNQNSFDKERLESTKLNLAVLEKHGIDWETFKESYQYYVINDAAYDEILKEIKDELNQEVSTPQNDSMQLQEFDNLQFN